MGCHAEQHGRDRWAGTETGQAPADAEQGGPVTSGRSIRVFVGRWKAASKAGRGRRRARA